MIKKIVDNYYEMVIEGTAKELGIPAEDIEAGFKKDLKQATARVAIVIGNSEEDADAHTLFIDLKAFNGSLTDSALAEFNDLLQKKAKG